MAAQQDYDSIDSLLAGSVSSRGSFDTTSTDSPPSLVSSEGNSTLSDSENASSGYTLPFRAYALPDSDEDASRADDAISPPPSTLGGGQISSAESVPASEFTAEDSNIASRGLHSDILDETDCLFGSALELLADLAMTPADYAMPAYATTATPDVESPATGKQYAAMASNGVHSAAINMWLNDDDDRLYDRLNTSSL